MGHIDLNGQRTTGTVGIQFGGDSGCQQAYIQSAHVLFCDVGCKLIGDTGKGVYMNNIAHLYSRFNNTGIYIKSLNDQPYEVNANRFGFVSLQNNTTDALLIDGGDGNFFDFIECESNTADAIDLRKGRSVYIAGGWIEGNGHNVRIADDPDFGSVFANFACDTLLTSTDIKFSHTYSGNRQIRFGLQTDERTIGRTRFGGDVRIGTDGSVGNDQGVFRLGVSGGMDVYRLASNNKYFFFRGNSADMGYYFSIDGGSTGLVDFNQTSFNYRGNPVGRKVAVPSTATSTGNVGEWAADSEYYYVCTASNTWKRAAIQAW